MGFKASGESVPAPVGSVYCVPEVTRFDINPKLVELYGRLITIRDDQGNIAFSEKKKIIRNASNKPVATIKRQLFSLRGKWKAYGMNNLLFTMVRSAFFQWKASYDIFLPGNHSPSPDFIVKRDQSNHNFTVCYQDATIAEIQGKGKRKSRHYYIIVQPAIDYAFISLIVTIIRK